MNEAIKRAERIVEEIKSDLAMHERSAPGEYRDKKIAELRKQLVKREQTVATLKVEAK